MAPYPLIARKGTVPSVASTTLGTNQKSPGLVRILAD